MTITPARARGLVDPVTGGLLALTRGTATWITPGGERSDRSPPHGWTCAAVGTAAVALAGDEQLTWWGDGSTRTVAAPALHRLAVVGPVVAGADEHGEVAVWPDLDHPPLSVSTGLEPDVVMLDVARRRLALSGLRAGPAVVGAPAVTGVQWGAGSPVAHELRAVAATGVLAFPVLDGAVATATEAEIRIVSWSGVPVRALPLAGVESLAASGSGAVLGWIRTPVRGAPRVGYACLLGPTAHPEVNDVKWSLSDVDPVGVALAVTDEPALVLVAGVSPDRLLVCRLDRDGWRPPSRIQL